MANANKNSNTFGFNVPYGIVAHKELNKADEHTASHMRKALSAFGIPKEEREERIAKASQGLRKCSVCKEYMPGRNFISSRCSSCVTFREEQYAKGEAKAEALKKERKARAEDKAQFVIGIPLLPIRNSTKINWYGPLSSYMEVYNFLAKVYPDPDSVPKEIKIDFKHTLKGPFYSLRELEDDLIYLEEYKAAKRKST